MPGGKKVATVRSPAKQVKASQDTVGGAGVPKFQQNRGHTRDWESSSGKETQEVTFFDRESDIQKEWRAKREAAYDASQSPPRSSVPGAVENAGSFTPEVRKLDEELQAAQIKEGWSDAQLDFERKKAAKKAGIPVEDLHKVNTEETLWNEGADWLMEQMGGAASPIPSERLPMREPREVLNEPKKAAEEEPEEVEGFDINIPKCYRKKKHHLTNPRENDASSDESYQKLLTGERPRDRWLRDHKNTFGYERFTVGAELPSGPFDAPTGMQDRLVAAEMAHVAQTHPNPAYAQAAAEIAQRHALSAVEAEENLWCNINQEDASKQESQEGVTTEAEPEPPAVHPVLDVPAFHDPYLHHHAPALWREYLVDQPYSVRGSAAPYHHMAPRLPHPGFNYYR